MSDPRLFALPPGVDFPRALVRGLIERMAGQPPEAMARVRLLANSGRMQRRIREEFDRHGAMFLPRMGLVTDFAAHPLPGVPPAVPDLRRRLELAQLVRGLTARLPQFEAGTSEMALADSLAALMAEMQDEGVTPEVLETLDIAETHGAHWQRSLDFIRIVARYFDLAEAPDRQGRQRRAIEATTQDWSKTPPRDPVVIAGSTGSRGSTALLMQAVARLPSGYVVLPGFDFDMPQTAWDSLYSGAIPGEDHPQFRFRSMLETLGLQRADVQRWTMATPAAPGRNALVSLALRPPPVTDRWMQEGRELPDLAQVTADMTLIEASDPRREALAIALVLREAAETGQHAAVITPDRLLTRRIAAALDRWGIVPDDSAGHPLQQTAPGRLLRHVAAMQGRRPTLETLLLLLKHPLTATGGGMRGAHLRFTRELELRLRRYGPAFPDAAALQKWAGTEDPARRLWVDWLAEVIAGLEHAGSEPLSAMIETHLARSERLAAGPGGRAEASELWREAGGMECLRLFEELRAEASFGGDYSPADYSDLVTRLLQGGLVRESGAAHPLISIQGTLEARAIEADLVILAGLNEGVWPATPAPDPWLSRKMRLDSGLLLPERQIGLSAHDFQIAIGAPRVVLSRARRDADAETIPARWLNRMTNLLGGLAETGGPEALAQMRRRGQAWLAQAEALEAPRMRLERAARPAPRPPVEARPRELPVTAIKKLIRDPYAVYAERILRLRPLDPLRPAPDPRERGQVLHLIVERFVKGRPVAEALDAAVSRLRQIAEETVAAEVPWPSAQRLWLARIGRIAEKFATDEARRAELGHPAVIEKKGSIPLQKVMFTLTAKPDRIDILEDGSVHIFDYKSGVPPKKPEVLHFDKQLLLEAAMAERGAFEQIGPRHVHAMTYVRLGGEGETVDISTDDETIDEVWQKFEALMARYLQADQGYTSRRAMQKSEDRGDFDHLARYGEWELSAAPQPEVLE
ncbi:MAG: double-strand break repair protein AddB [Sphingomonadales bacterium]|nr:double-strand break repair protein AddB [Sphingomonadales bacterium]